MRNRQIDLSGGHQKMMRVVSTGDFDWVRTHPRMLTVAVDHTDPAVKDKNHIVVGGSTAAGD